MIHKYDVALVGGGITGLMAAQKLSDIGMRVVLIEKHATFASGPSTRNEGWLHRGTYHAASIRDRATALQVASRCIYGHEQLRRFSPEALEDIDVKPLVLIRAEDRVSEVVSRWDEAEVRYRPISLSAAKARIPAANFDNAAAVFEADDVSLNTRLLYRKLHALARKAGCDFFVGAEILRIEGQAATIKDMDGRINAVEAQKFVYSAGTGAKSAFQEYHNIELPIRYWKSHLVVTKRLASAGVFYVDAHEAAMMHHGQMSIVGLNEDAMLCHAPSYDVVPDRAQNLRNAIRRIFPDWIGEDAVDIACTKVDLVSDTDSARSLNIAIREPKPGHICVLPGKMTEAPYLTDVLTSYLHHHLDDSPISMRPCDEFVREEAPLKVA
ncbi:FAD-dependent oxidoreductase [Mesorhizobium sp. B1-1-5]|uniref:NAD(P)/FAD-dependent oxidoreductase n=1 Tax=Mesorhizobium sp. B1-1-5 TaxID=2589979 RepID=UPI00112CCCB5|nr:FAD-dependent oxidoreductase [Mesorhizobium sp. B1-1-5]TPO13745.1 FAD-binding oxidoreductase [Mesorhizobium sp. B1-1-5]